MSRLRKEWMTTLEDELVAYEQELILKIGLDFVGIAAACGGVSRSTILEASDTVGIAVVTVTSGLGEISGFAGCVAAILSQAGFNTKIMPHTDVHGLFDAYRADNIGFAFLADDDTYIAIDLNRRCVSENSNATARAFVTALDAMVPDGIKGEDVLVMGCGRVGMRAGQILLEKQAVPIFYDKYKMPNSVGEFSDFSFCTRVEEIKEYKYILDATSEGDWLSSDMLHKGAIIAAPGVPLSLTEDSAKSFAHSLVHDILHIGTLAMLGELCGELYS